MSAIVDDLLEPVPGGKPGQRRIRADRWPDPGFVDVGIRGDLGELEGSRYEEPDTFGGELGERRFIDVVSDVMARRMEEDSSIVVLGEDVDGLKGGTNGATRRPLEKFPERVLGTPISENAFAGMGGGMALDGRFRPVVEFMYADFMWVAADQIFNQIAKARHMFGGDERRAAGAAQQAGGRAPATAPSTRWTRRASSPQLRACASSPPRTPSTTSG